MISCSAAARRVGLPHRGHLMYRRLQPGAAGKQPPVLAFLRLFDHATTAWSRHQCAWCSRLVQRTAFLPSSPWLLTAREMPEAGDGERCRSQLRVRSFPACGDLREAFLPLLCGLCGAAGVVVLLLFAGNVSQGDRPPAAITALSTRSRIDSSVKSRDPHTTHHTFSRVAL